MFCLRQDGRSYHTATKWESLLVLPVKKLAQFNDFYIMTTQTLIILLVISHFNSSVCMSNCRILPAQTIITLDDQRCVSSTFSHHLRSKQMLSCLWLNQWSVLIKAPLFTPNYIVSTDYTLSTLSTYVSPFPLPLLNLFCNWAHIKLAESRAASLFIYFGLLWTTLFKALTATPSREI